MPATRIAVAVVFALASMSTALAGKPSDPSGYGSRTSDSARSGGFGSSVSSSAQSGDRGYSDTRFDPINSDSIPTNMPTPSDNNPNAPSQLPAGFF
jgi:hypothetical protein